MQRIKELCGIESDIVIEDDVDDELDTGFMSAMPALTLVKAFALEKNLVLRFARRDELVIRTRATEMKQRMAPSAATVNLDEVESYEIEK